MNQRKVCCWAVVPAAGTGSRMGAALPKQYLEVAGVTLLEHSVRALLACPQIDGVVVALNPQDSRASALSIFADPRVHTVDGAEQRSGSVLAGLDALASLGVIQDWVLVHDVARPCVREADIDSLLDELAENRVGGLLGAPLTDTIKEVGADGAVKATADRSRLWRALTPQVFRFEVLDRALQSARENSAKITDEASAVELLGLQPRLVAGCADNIKVTVPEDLALAAWILRGH